MVGAQVIHFGKKGSPPGPEGMCYHYLKPMHRCTLKHGHTGDHRYSRFTITKIKEK